MTVNELAKEYHDTGACFGTYYKNVDNFEKKNGVCYIPELSEEKYSYTDYMALAQTYFKDNKLKGNPEVLARQLFDFSEWQHPETLIDEWESMGEFRDYAKEHGIET